MLLHLAHLPRALVYGGLLDIQLKALLGRTVVRLHERVLVLLLHFHVGLVLLVGSHLKRATVAVREYLFADINLRVHGCVKECLIGSVYKGPFCSAIWDISLLIGSRAVLGIHVFDGHLEHGSLRFL